MNQKTLQVMPITLSDMSAAIGAGWRIYRGSTAASAGYASVAAIVGLVILMSIAHFGLSPMSLPFAGGFMLVGPVMLSGFFHIAIQVQQGNTPRVREPFQAFFRVPPTLWMIAVFCAFLFLIWITDAGVLYSFQIGGNIPSQLYPWLSAPVEKTLTFWFWGSLMGSVLAFVIFSISAFSVPLIYQGRANLVVAVTASVRAVFRNFVTCISWALMISIATVIAITILPLLLLVLPVLAYAGFVLYQQVFPQQVNTAPHGPLPTSAR